MINRPKLILAAICVLAAGLRTLGLDHGLPAVYVPEESLVLNSALAVPQSLTPQRFTHPSLYPYLLFIWQGMYFVAGRLVGHFDSLLSFQQQLMVDPSGHFLVGRAFSVLCGTLTVVAAYLLGRRLYDRPTGLVAAAALAVSPIAVRDAHYMKIDAPGAMFLALAHVALARILVDAGAATHRRYWIVAGLLSGLAISLDYYAAFVAFSMAAVALVDLKRSGTWRESARLFLWCSAAALVGFLSGSPAIPFNLGRFVADAASGAGVDIGWGAVGAMVAYLRILVSDAMGWPVGIAAFAGFVLALATDWRRGLLLVSFLVPFFVFVAITLPVSRQVNLVLPMMAVAAAFAGTRIGRGLTNPTRLTLLLTLPFIPGLLGSLAWDTFLRRSDTRSLAAGFIESTVPAGGSLLVQPFGPALRQSREGLLESLRVNLGSESKAPIRFQLMLAVSPYPQPSYRLFHLGGDHADESVDRMYIVPAEFTPDEGLAPLRRAGIEFVLLNHASTAGQDLHELEAALAREGKRLATFSPHRADATMAERAGAPPFLHQTVGGVHRTLERPGPAIEIWVVAEKPGARRWGAPGS
jgi:hypothetical protein